MKSFFKKLFALSLSGILTVAVLSSCGKDDDPPTPDDDNDPPATVEDVTVAESGVFNYAVVYGENNNLSTRWATGLFRTFLYTEFGVEIYPVADTTPEAELEVLIGETSRTLSQTLKAKAMEGYTNDDEVWAYAYADGKLAIYSNCQAGFERALESLKENYVNSDGKLVVPGNLEKTFVYTKAEKDAQAAADAAAEREARLAELKAQNAAFLDSQFGEPKSMGDSPYAEPLHTPKKGEHPRVFLTKKDIPRIKSLLESEELKSLSENFWRTANEKNFTGIFKETVKNGVTIRWDTHYFDVVEAKALAYVLTGDELYAYEAIVGIKNMMLTLKFESVIHGDTYHGADEVITHASMVYDMCYDVLTDTDKKQIIGGMVNLLWPQMEFNFPPKNLSAVSGHGTGSQFLRTYVATALTVCDEMPDWWEFVGGRYYQEYLPVINHCYQAGWVSQGTSNYGDLKLQINFLSAFYVWNATGEMPLVSGGRLAPYFMISHIMPNDKYFLTGDGGRNATGGTVAPHFLILGAKLFNDPTLAAWGKYFTKDYTTGFQHRYSRTVSYSNVLIWLSGAPKPVDDPTKTTELIEYLPFPSGTMTARNSWDSDAAVVLMRVGSQTMSNHDGYDHGTFQIYYKGLLALTSGSYSLYGSNQHKYYLQGTVGQNGLLIYNPALGTDTPVYGTKKDADGNDVPDPLNVTNGAQYFYDGGQKRRGSASEINNWLGGSFDMGTVMGADEKYVSGKPLYAYISGDITKSYDSVTVDYVGRRMLTIYTGDEDIPMLFLTFDTMTSTDPSFRKSFLLHTAKEPTVDKNNMTATVTNGDGKLQLVSLYGPDFIEKIGGEGYAYWISGSTFYNEDGTLNGKNCVDKSTPKDNHTTIWGRIELVKEPGDNPGNVTDSFLTLMYVSDKTSTETLSVEKFKEGSIYGARIKNVVTAFIESEVSVTSQVTFTAGGEGNMEYYVSGLENGSWDVYIGGTKHSTVKMNKDSDMLYFKAPAGTVTLTPGEDVEGALGGKIVYELYGATIPDDAPTSYDSTAATPLPTLVTRGDDVFIGWYDSPDFDNATLLTEIPAGSTGQVKLYARFRSVYIDMDYDTAPTDVNIQELRVTVDGIEYSGSDKPGSSFVIKTDADGEKYLEWKKGTKDPNLSIFNDNKNFAQMTTSGDECVSYTLTFARDGSAPVTTVEFRIMSNTSTTNKTAKLIFGKLNASGKLVLPDGSEVATLPASGKMTIRLVVDFKNAKVIAYEEDGTVIDSSDLTIPSNSPATSLSEFRTHCNKYIFYPYSFNVSSAATVEHVVRIYEMRIEEGNVFKTN